jgi:hypothetical protein
MELCIYTLNFFLIPRHSFHAIVSDGKRVFMVAFPFLIAFFFISNEDNIKHTTNN